MDHGQHIGKKLDEAGSKRNKGDRSQGIPEELHLAMKI